MVQLIEDQCVTYDTDGEMCTEYEDIGAKVIHVYDDEAWYITGLEVREDHGLDFAMLAENPQVDSDLTTDETLWQVATNLNLTFIEGVECIPASESDTTCTADGSREVTVDKIANTYFGDSNTGWMGTDAVSITVGHETYQHQGYLNQVMMTDTVEFLDTVFASYTDNVPTLLFAYEETARTLNLDDATSITETLTMDLSPTEVYTDVYAHLSWSPYRYTEGAWENYPIDEYLDYLDSQLRDHPDFAPDDSSDESLEAVEGQIILAQFYYLSLYNGLTGLTEVGGIPITTPAYSTSYTFQPEYPYVSFRFSLLLLDVATILLPKALTFVGTQIETSGSNWHKAVWREVNDIFSSDSTKTSKFTKFNTVGMRSGFKSELALFADVPVSKKGFGAIGLTTVSLLAVTALALVECSSCNAMAVAAVGASGVVAGVQTINLTATLYRTAKAAEQGSKLSSLNKIAKANRTGNVVGTVIAAALSWAPIVMAAIQGGEITQQALAYAFAQFAVTIILFLITLIPIVGQLIELLIALVDVISFLLCEVGATNTFCTGLTGWLTEAIAKAIYEVNEYVDLDNPDRLDYQITDVTFESSDEGFSTLNQVRYTMAITNTIFDIADIPYNDGGEKAKKATFDYHLQATEEDQHDDLDLNEMKDEWVKYTENGRKKVEGYFNPTSVAVSFADVGAGINQDLSGWLYLSESFAVPIEECVKYPFYTDCSFKAQRDSIHTEMGENIVYDIFPYNLKTFTTYLLVMVAMPWHGQVMAAPLVPHNKRVFLRLVSA